MTMNGELKDDEKFRSVMGYVEQFDAMFKQDSALEAVQFAAALKLADSVTAVQRDLWIEQIFEMLEMTSLRDTEVDHMTVEQRKRLNMAVELAGNPAILFLDGNQSIYQPIHQPVLLSHATTDSYFYYLL